MTNANPYEAPESELEQAPAEQKTTNKKKVPNKRVCAFLVDMLCLVSIEAILGIIVAEIVWVLDAAYLLLRDALFQGRSIGKYFVGLQVVNASGEPCTLLRSAVRNAIFLLPIIIIIEYVVMRFSPQERRLGDLIAKTTVLDLRPDRSDTLFMLLSIVVIVVFLIVGGILLTIISSQFMN